MSVVIPFPVRGVWRELREGPSEPGVILILPVVRIDRDAGTPAPHRQRRMRGKTASQCVVDDMVGDDK